MQEVRYSQAELALIDNDLKEALGYLQQNLEPGAPHIPTYLMLSRIFYSQEEYSKSFRVLYVLIRRLHPVDGQQILNLQYSDTISRFIRNMAPPNREALEIYFLIGQNYFRLAESGAFTGDFRAQLYELAAKYFNITDYYRFELPQTNYYLGVISSRRRRYQDAITRLIEARDLFSQDEGPETKTQVQNINFLLGDSLIREGYRDAGTLYLNSIYLDEEANDSLKQYSRSYLDNLASSYSLITVGVTGNYRQNLYRFTDTRLNDFSLFEPIIGGRDGSSVAKSLNYLYSSRRFNKMIYTARVNFREDLQRDDIHWRLDNRIINASIEAKYDNLRRSLLKFNYSQLYIFTRPDLNEDFKINTTDHNFNVEYVHTLKKGTLSYRLPVTYRKRRNFNTTMNKGLALNYVPFYRTRWVGPSFSTEFSLIEELNFATSKRLRASVSNHIRYSPIVSTFIFASYTKLDHELDSLSLDEYSVTLFTNVLLRFVQNLSANFSIARTMANTGESDKINTMTYSAGINYSF